MNKEFSEQINNNYGKQEKLFIRLGNERINSEMTILLFNSRVKRHETIDI